MVHMPYTVYDEKKRRPRWNKQAVFLQLSHLPCVFHEKGSPPVSQFKQDVYLIPGTDFVFWCEVLI